MDLGQQLPIRRRLPFLGRSSQDPDSTRAPKLLNEPARRGFPQWQDLAHTDRSQGRPRRVERFASHVRSHDSRISWRTSMETTFPSGARSSDSFASDSMTAGIPLRWPKIPEIALAPRRGPSDESQRTQTNGARLRPFRPVSRPRKRVLGFKGKRTGVSSFAFSSAVPEKTEEKR